NSQILYKETISNVVEGIGHFEPLRHYAEVHLVLEPGEPGSGLVFGSVLPTDRLGATWQNMILYHLQEKIHLGVLGGFPLTDVRITLVGGKISLKHTEGGDIREASLRAVRHGLMNAKNVLLEPFFHYSLIIPTNNVGRAANDIQQMSGNFSIETLDDGFSKLTGYAPVSEMQSYYSEVIAYTSGHGKLTCVSGGYRPCHNSSEVLSSLSYDPESDLANTPDSIFCKHGAGFLVKWNDVTHYMHIDSFIKPEKADNTHATPHRKIDLDEKALEELMMKEFGPIRRRQYGKAAIIRTAADDSEDDEPKQHYIIIDGYNLMFLLEEKGIISSGSLDLSRKEMLNLLSNYSGFSGNHILVVFDAYHNDTSTDKRMIEDGIDIIYTEYGETADAYIERTANTLGKNDHVRVISSDNLVRLGVFRSGIQRTSSAYFYEELVNSQSNLNKILEAHKIKEGQVLSDFINEDTLKQWQKKLN
ncbi:MAG: NYN domain-containing protein, partial [Oscillospiraceae bacterium]|nr:NYN domain-containing protein [Oscillospiraceae bacterium]